jgi:hypothetical protein
MTVSIMGDSFSPGGNEIGPRTRSPAIPCMVVTGVSDARLLINLAHTEPGGELPPIGGCASSPPWWPRRRRRAWPHRVSPRRRRIARARRHCLPGPSLGHRPRQWWYERGGMAR